MGVLFKNILEISIMVSFLILAVLLIRLIFKKASASFRCILWMLVGIRLLIPVSISSPFGLVPDVDLTLEQEYLTSEGHRSGAGLETTDNSTIENVVTGNVGVGNTIIGNGAAETNKGHAHPDADGMVPGTGSGSEETRIPGADSGSEVTQNSGNEVSQGFGDTEENLSAGIESISDGALVWKIGAAVWLAGTCLMLAYMLISWLRLRHSLQEALPEYVSGAGKSVKVYRHDNVDSPFLMGVIVPKIYVPIGLTGQELQFVLAHEQMHLRRRDHWLKPMSFLVLALYWFHPLVWVAFVLLGRDIELACDERVLQEHPKLDRAAYAKALLYCAVKQRRIAVCPVAFGEVDVKQRVTNVLNYKKPGFWIVLVCAVLAVIVVLCFMTVSGDGEDSLPAGIEDVQADGENQTAAKDPENELIFYYPVNSLNAPGYQPARESESLAPDCFWAGNGRIFVDDTLNNRVLVYQNGTYEKTIELPWEMDVLKMHYLQEADELKVVFRDRNISTPNYYLAGIDVSSGMILDAGKWDQEIGNLNENLVSCCFDSEGVLWKDIRYDKVQEPDEATKQANHIVTLGGTGEFPYATSEAWSAIWTSDSWGVVGMHGEDVYRLHSEFVQRDEGNLVLSVIMKNDTHVAAPEPDWDGGPALSLGPAGDLYQMVVDEGGVRIYRLGFAEFDEKDRDDMLARQIQLSEVTVRNDLPASMASVENFNLLTIEQMRELTNEGRLSGLVKEQGMRLFEGYQNLEPAVLYKGASGSSCSCVMDYEGKPYELTIMYKIAKDNPDEKNIQRIYVTALENSMKATLYSTDDSEETEDFVSFINRSYGVEKCITYTLPEGYTLGPYSEYFMSYRSSLLVSDVKIEERPENQYASNWAVAPGGIGTFSNPLTSMIFENGAPIGFSHWGGIHAWMDMDSCETVEGCFTSALLAVCSFDRMTSAEHYELMQKYPEIAADRERVGPIDHWFVFICDENNDVGYFVFLNQEYFTKEDAIALARSIQPKE